MSMSLTKSFSLSLNDCKDPGKEGTELSITFTSAQYVIFRNVFFVSFSELCPGDLQSVSSQREELCAKVFVRIGETEVNAELFEQSNDHMIQRLFTEELVCSSLSIGQ